MWRDQVVPDFNRLRSSAASEWIVNDIKTLAAYAKMADGVDYRVIKMDEAELGDALARRADDGRLEIYYPAAFDGALSRDKYLAMYIILAHEISHHLLKHTAKNAPPITQRHELEADQLAGCLFMGVVSNTRTPMGPPKHIKEQVEFKDVAAYFGTHAKDVGPGVHASVDERLNWVWSGWAHAMIKGKCTGMTPPTQ